VVKQSNWNTNDPQYYGELFPDPFRFDRVCALADTNVCTSDGGRRSRRSSGRCTSTTITSASTRRLAAHLVGNDGGLYESRRRRRRRGGTSRFPPRSSTDHRSTTPLPFYNIYGGTQDNGSIGTPSRSAHPTGIRASEIMTVGGGDGFQARADQVDNNVLYVSSQNGAIQRLDKRTARPSRSPPRHVG
jgi:hypothetical protein